MTRSFLPALVAVLVGCSGAVATEGASSETTSAAAAGATACGACNHPAGYCLSRPSGQGMEPAECTQLGGTPVPACPTQALVGVCRTEAAASEPWDRYYYESCATAPREACEGARGAWRRMP